MSKSITKIISGAGTIIHLFVIPVFVLVFTIYYRPLVIYEGLSMANASFTFNATILFSILFVTISITRGCLYLIGRFKELSVIPYLSWCLAETVISALFCALYIVLMSDGLSFFETAGKAFISLFAMVIYPYAFLWFGFELRSRTAEEPAQAEDTSLIRFYDEYKKLRFVIAPEAVMFIKSEDNYVQIHYLDKNTTKKFVLRSSMRALEEDVAKHGLIRCHRVPDQSYFINPNYIKIVHRDSSGLIVAELNQDGFDSIPISRKYQNEITRLL